MTASDGVAERTYTVTVTRAAYSCAAPDLSDRGEIWTGTLTVGESAGGSSEYGYSASGVGHGDLSDAMFNTISDSYAVDGVLLESGTGALLFSLESQLASADSGNLRLHVCDAEFEFGDATYSMDAFHDYAWSGTGLDWSTAATVSLALSSASIDATLSGLELAEEEGGAVALNEAFDPVELEYTASVANTVAQVTVTPAVNDAYATVEYLDGNDNPLIDADGVKAGQQVNLRVGANVIGVRVRAQDGTTTRTYRVDVSRTAFVCAAPDLSDRVEIWTADLTVGRPAGLAGYSRDSYGHLSDRFFNTRPDSLTSNYHHEIDRIVVDSSTEGLKFSLDEKRLSDVNSRGFLLHVLRCAFRVRRGDLFRRRRI